MRPIATIVIPAKWNQNVKECFEQRLNREFTAIDFDIREDAAAERIEVKGLDRNGADLGSV